MNLKNIHSVKAGVLFNDRYWEKDEMEKAFVQVRKAFSDTSDEDIKIEPVSVKTEEDFESFLHKTKGQPVVLVPMSGGVQPWMMKIGKSAEFIVIVQGYFQDFFNPEITGALIEKNAPPALADTYAVLKRMGTYTYIAYTRKNLLDLLKVYNTLESLKKSTILFAGEPEPWVISSVKSGKRIEEKFGIRTNNISLDQVEERFRNANPEKTVEFAKTWLDNAKDLVEPVKFDVYQAAALQWAILDLLREHDADCFCAKCFELIGRINTTTCLGISYLNSTLNYCGACEGDLDSAVSLMIMKNLTGQKTWMANPIVMEKDKLILSHCSAPLVEDKGVYTLRSHHESGVGVSTEVEMPVNKEVTLMRVGNNLNKIQFFKGFAESIPDISTCRTKLQIHVEGLDQRIEKILGCHYIMVYGDYTEMLRIFSKIADLIIMN